MHNLIPAYFYKMGDTVENGLGTNRVFPGVDYAAALGGHMSNAFAMCVLWYEAIEQ